LCPETKEHSKIKEKVLEKLRELYGAGLEEYPHGGQINDVYIITPNQRSIFIENIWTSTPGNFQRDLNIMHRSPADVKILIVNPKIIKDKKLRREFEKTRMSEIDRGISVSNMIDGLKILKDDKFLDEEFPKIVKELMNESLSNISVSPKSMLLGGSWQDQSLFKVHNRTGEIYYQICVKLIFDAPNVSTKDVQVEIVNPKREFKIKNEKIELCADVVRYDVRDDAGNDAILLSIGSLDPKETLSFVLVKKSLSSSDVLFPTKVILSVIGFSHEPTKMMAKKGKVGFQFRMYESVTLKSISVKLRRVPKAI